VRPDEWDPGDLCYVARRSWNVMCHVSGRAARVDEGDALVFLGITKRYADPVALLYCHPGIVVLWDYLYLPDVIKRHM
jgi:hypothetical protein